MLWSNVVGPPFCLLCLYVYSELVVSHHALTVMDRRLSLVAHDLALSSKEQEQCNLRARPKTAMNAKDFIQSPTFVFLGSSCRLLLENSRTTLYLWNCLHSSLQTWVAMKWQSMLTAKFFGWQFITCKISDPSREMQLASQESQLVWEPFPSLENDHPPFLLVKPKLIPTFSAALTLSVHAAIILGIMSGNSQMRFLEVCEANRSVSKWPFSRLSCQISRFGLIFLEY